MVVTGTQLTQAKLNTGLLGYGLSPAWVVREEGGGAGAGTCRGRGGGWKGGCKGYQKCEGAECECFNMSDRTSTEKTNSCKLGTTAQCSPNLVMHLSVASLGGRRLQNEMERQPLYLNLRLHFRHRFRRQVGVLKGLCSFVTRLVCTV